MPPPPMNTKCKSTADAEAPVPVRSAGYEPWEGGGAVLYQFTIFAYLYSVSVCEYACACVCVCVCVSWDQVQGLQKQSDGHSSVWSHHTPVT